MSASTDLISNLNNNMIDNVRLAEMYEHKEEYKVTSNESQEERNKKAETFKEVKCDKQ